MSKRLHIESSNSKSSDFGQSWHPGRLLRSSFTASKLRSSLFLGHQPWLKLTTFRTAGLNRDLVSNADILRLNSSLYVLICLFFLASSVVLPNPCFALDNLGSSIQENAAAKLVIDKSVYNFETVLQGEPVSYSFKIRNVGNAPLLINRILPDCGCTAAVAEKKELLSGEETYIQSTFDTTGFQGYKVKTIRVYTNDPQHASLTLGFRGTVKTEVDINPPRVFFGNIRKGSSARKTVEISIDSDSEIEIAEILSRSDDIDLSVGVATKREGKKVQKFSVALKDSVPVGLYKSRVIIKTTSEKKPIVNIPVFARVEGDLKLIPSDVSFGLLAGPLKKTVSAKVRLINRGTRSIRILSVQSSSQSLDVSYSEKKVGKEYELVVTLKEGIEGTLKEHVSIVTDHVDNEQNELSLPVYGIVTKQGS